jgi:hypothetical protein
MSRISRYQESFKKFIKNKSCIINTEGNIQKDIHTMIDESDNIIGILLLTTLNNQGKKTKMNILHGYHLAAGLELLIYAVSIMDTKNIYNKRFTENGVNDILTRIVPFVNISLFNNIETLQENYTANTYHKFIKMIYNTVRIINLKIHKIFTEKNFTLEDNIMKTDVIKYKFEDMDRAKSKLKKLRRINKSELDTYINETYGLVCQMALVSGWLLGRGDEKNIINMEKMGICFGWMVKTVRDFINIENDLINADTYTKNTIINNGFQPSFEIFITNKHKFIDGCIKYNMYSHTIKEIIDTMEQKMDTVIDNSSPDLKSHYTLSMEKTEKNNINIITDGEIDFLDNN